MQIAERVSASCADFVGLGQILANGPSSNQIYDGFDACVATDKIMSFAVDPGVCGYETLMREKSLSLRVRANGPALRMTCVLSPRLVKMEPLALTCFWALALRMNLMGKWVMIVFTVSAARIS